MAEPLALFATTPRGLERVLADELRELGAARVRAVRAGVAFEGDLELAYRACLWSRIASRVLLNLARFPVPDGDALYDAVRAIPWEEHLDPDGTLAVDATLSGGSPIDHSHFAALRVKDAVVDRLREHFGRRPSVDRVRPSLRLNLVLQGRRGVLSLDLAGEALHRRGYRPSGATAPLKENLAAGLLRLAGWPETAARGGALVDPLCGTGTLPVEAALMAADVAPGLGRDYFGFIGWLGHVPALWARLTEEARERAGSGGCPPLIASDRDPAMVALARRAAAAAGVEARIRFEVRPLDAILPPDRCEAGLVVANPPYGERLGDRAGAEAVHEELGRVLRAGFRGWRAAVLSGDVRLARRLGAEAATAHSLYNGALACTLTCWEVGAKAPAWSRSVRDGAAALAPGAADPGASMFADRLRKNLRHLGRWARREGIDAYRVYDADLPEYALAVDRYQCADGLFARVQEYAPPPGVDPNRAAARRDAALAAVAEVLEIEPAAVSYRLRAPQRGDAQYRREAAAPRFHEVREGGCRLLVDFHAHLDTGLFLDHRPTRLALRELASGKRFLNLFCYTGAATVHAAAGGALGSTSVDLSATYLEWARRNLDLNDCDRELHELVRADCLDWLAQAARERRRYGTVFADPPTFSNSKRIERDFDVQRDHVRLILGAVELLTPRGVLVFSTNFRRFRLDAAALAGLRIEETTRQTVPEDFRRNPRIHRCWRISRPAGAESR